MFFKRCYHFTYHNAFRFEHLLWNAKEAAYVFIRRLLNLLERGDTLGVMPRFYLLDMLQRHNFLR